MKPGTRFHIPIRDAPPRFPPVSRIQRLEIRNCMGCLRCVKRDLCVYQAYSRGRIVPETLQDTTDTLCANCLRCVQECKNHIILRAPNPAYAQLGNAYWSPDIITSLWEQAESGRIPVSGAGYRGPFVGPGFDAMWTDMSEIVRPTRDGIHGREFISTVVEFGSRPDVLAFHEDGSLLTPMPSFRELAIPVLFDPPPHPFSHAANLQGMAEAARRLRTLMTARLAEAQGPLARFRNQLLVRLSRPEETAADFRGLAAVALPFHEGLASVFESLRGRFPELVSGVEVPLDEYALDRTLVAAYAGAGFVHVRADFEGRGLGKRRSDFVIRLVRDIHRALLNARLRDRLTLLVSGGIAMAEHVAKIIVCGADVCAIDHALWVALECRLCRDCAERPECPASIGHAPFRWTVHRITNLLAAWHAQLLEVLGAMGLREVRRLRGELGRAMFFEDLERENFSPLFGIRTHDAPICPIGAPPPDDGPPRAEITHERFPPAQNRIAPCPSRFRNPIARYHVMRTSCCTLCGRCLEICAYGVHRRRGNRMREPLHAACRGPQRCRQAERFCEAACPAGALRIIPNPIWDTLGDPRWTADLIAGTWWQAETGTPPDHLEYRSGASGGGFDRIRLVFPKKLPAGHLRPDQVDLRIPLNRRGDGRPDVTTGFPVYGGGMSFGSISLATMVARARAYAAFSSFTCTGEGGYPEELKPYDTAVITQVATGLFGVREETIQRTRIVEFKYAQGAKPGLGGHLLGDKVTPAVAALREAVEGNALFSPFPFHSVYSVEDHKKHVDWIKQVNPRALVSVKVSTPTDVDMVAVGSYYAGAHIIHLDGSYGGTGAAPDIAKKNIAMPIEYAIPKVHRFLQEEGIRDRITLMVSGGLRSAWDVAKAIALGADGAVIGTAELVALECVRCGACESGRGCPRGIATTDPELAAALDVEWATQRLINLFHSWCVQLQGICWTLGLRSIRELVGRTDTLCHLDYTA